MNVVCIVQARTNSNRFPCKVLANLAGRPMVSHVLERAARIPGVLRTVLAIPRGDRPMLGHLWPQVYDGEEHDVLGRYASCARLLSADLIVRVTGDCPLLAPDLGGEAVSLALQYAAETGRTDCYVASCQPYVQTADGWDVEVIGMELLDWADKECRLKSEREHVTPSLRGRWPVLLPDWKEKASYAYMKLSVDTTQDLERVAWIYALLPEQKTFGYEETAAAWLKMCEAAHR